MANKKTVIHVVKEREGPTLYRGFTTEEDAWNYFNHEVAIGNLSTQWDTVGQVVVENFDIQEPTK